MTLQDNRLIALSLREPSHFVTVFDRHGAAVHAYLARRAGYQTAEDLSAEVWLQAFRSRQAFDPAWADALPWLYGIARNTLRHHWRRVPVGAFPLEPAHDPWAEVDDRLDAARRVHLLQTALARLEAEDREVLLLSAWEQLEPTEVAIALDVPAGTVRWRLHRVRRTLADAFDPGDVGDSSLPATKEA